ncbi:MAG: methylated-DNA--[protein]-cysteine S-methyltransferase [Burkholderiales bacterium]
MKLVCNTIATPLGPMLLAASDAGLAGLWFEDQRYYPDGFGWQAVKSQRWLDQAAEEVQAYFRGQCRHFETRRAAAWGTPFQRNVWEALVAIPWGATTTYGTVAAQLHKPAAVRAVGAAVGRNPWSIMVPCHRVLGANGSLTGYAGGLARKQDLLRREGNPVP